MLKKIRDELIGGQTTVGFRMVFEGEYLQPNDIIEVRDWCRDNLKDGWWAKGEWTNTLLVVPVDDDDLLKVMLAWSDLGRLAAVSPQEQKFTKFEFDNLGLSI